MLHLSDIGKWSCLHAHRGAGGGTSFMFEVSGTSGNGLYVSSSLANLAKQLPSSRNNPPTRETTLLFAKQPVNSRNLRKNCRRANLYLTVAIFLISKISTPAVLSRILRKNYLISKTCETTTFLAKQPPFSRNNPPFGETTI